jgi:hypothetical protein
LLDAVHPVGIPYPEPVDNSLSVDQLAHLNMFDGLDYVVWLEPLVEDVLHDVRCELTSQNLPGVMPRKDTSEAKIPSSASVSFAANAATNRDPHRTHEHPPVRD